MSSAKRSLASNGYIITLIFGVGRGIMAQRSALAEVDIRPNTFATLAPGNSTRCPDSYFNLLDVDGLRFEESDIATVPPGGVPIGNGHQMQCLNTNKCYNYAPSHADCLRINDTGGEILWNCTAPHMPEDIVLTDVHVRCQEFARDDYCVYKGSCVMFYSLSRLSLIYGIVFGSIVLAVATIVGALSVYRLLRLRASRLASQTASSTSVATASGPGELYDPPPPYQPRAERPQTRHVTDTDSHSNLRLGAEIAEEDPPPYSSAVSEYLSK